MLVQSTDNISKGGCRGSTLLSFDRLLLVASSDERTCVGVSSVKPNTCVSVSKSLGGFFESFWPKALLMCVPEAYIYSP